MLKEEKVYVPKNEKLRAEIVQLYHDIPMGEHKEQQKTVELMIRNFWQPGVTKEVKKYIKGYNICQYNKN